MSAVFGWEQADQISGALNAIMLIGLLGLIGLSILLTAFKPQIAPFTGPVYAVVMGFWAGVISFGYEQGSTASCCRPCSRRSRSSRDVCSCTARAS